MMRKNKKIKRGKRTAFDGFLLAAGVLFAAVFIISVWNLGEYLADGSKSSRFAHSMQDSVIIVDRKEEGKEPEVPAAIDFDKLHEISEDAVAWIYSPGTEINYVIAQAQDNDYYLHRLLDGTAARGGTIFADCRNNADFSDWNTVIYGHHMKNGTMFASLLDYRSPGYYEEHPVMYLYTPGHRYRLELIAGYTADLDDPVYMLPASRQDRDGIVNHAGRRSSFISGVSIGDEDKLVTLSTCSYDYEDARYVVIGRLEEEENGWESGTND